MQFISDNRIFIVYTWDTAVKSLAVLSFDPMQPDLSPMPVSQRLIAYEPGVGPLSMNAVGMHAFSTSLSDDRKFMYIGGSIKGMSTLFRTPT
jgi:hypothetical protein